MDIPQPNKAIPASPKMGLALLSSVFGLVGLLGILPGVVFLTCGILPLGFGLGAIVIGIVAKSKADSDPLRYDGGVVAKAGIVFGILSIGVWGFFIFLMTLKNI